MCRLTPVRRGKKNQMSNSTINIISPNRPNVSPAISPALTG